MHKKLILMVFTISCFLVLAIVSPKQNVTFWHTFFEK